MLEKFPTDKLCVGCAWYRLANSLAMRNRHLCSFDSVTRDLVTGAIVVHTQSCYDMRDEKGRCGPAAIFWTRIDG